MTSRACEQTARDERNVLAAGATAFVSVVIPCLNEEQTIGGCVAEARSGLAAARVRGEVVVCDNGSDDCSVEVASRAGARVVHCAARGYGNAVRSGVEATRGGLIVMGDGDGSYDLAHIGPFFSALAEGADVVIGNRFRGGIELGAMPWKNRHLGTPALTFLTKLLFAAPVGDVNCGLRGFTRAAFDKMAPRTEGMEFATEMIARAAQARLRIVEVPTVLRPDGRNRAPHLRPWRDGWRHVRLLLTLRFQTPRDHPARANRAVIAADSLPRV